MGLFFATATSRTRNVSTNAACLIVSAVVSRSIVAVLGELTFPGPSRWGKGHTLSLSHESVEVVGWLFVLLEGGKQPVWPCILGTGTFCGFLPLRVVPHGQQNDCQ